jgi:beta-N-acetylhexosaminidase
LRDAAAVLFPTITDLVITKEIREHLAAGGRALLLGETRDEYVLRRMSEDRRYTEGPAEIRHLREDVDDLTPDHVLIAVDQELGGIQRLAGLVPDLPDVGAALQMAEKDLTEAIGHVGAGMASLGVDLCLAPILDIVRGRNPMLDGRHWGSDVREVVRLGLAFLEGMRHEGVATTAKHFPGHGRLLTDPHTTASVIDVGLPMLRRNDLTPFREVIQAGVYAVMVGPAVFARIDPHNPAALSPRVHSILRYELAFDGVAIADDLEMRSIQGGRSLTDTAIAALRSGCDLLLVGAECVLTLAQDIAHACVAGELDPARVAEAAGRVRRLADAHAATP